MCKNTKKREKCSKCCGRLHIHGRFKRVIRDIKGKKKYFEIIRYKCADCGKTISWPPSNVKKYDRYSKSCKKTIVKERIAYRNSLYELRDKFATKIEQRRPISTISYWTQKSGDIVAYKIKSIKIVFSGELIIDEVHIRVAKIWRKVIMAIDAVSRVIIAFNLLPKDENLMMRKAIAFFECVKISVGMPRIVTTDMHRMYWEGILSVFKDSKHQYCVFHTIKLIYKKLEGWYGKKKKWAPQIKHLFEEVKQMFKSTTVAEAKMKLQKLIDSKMMYTKEKAIKIIFLLDNLQNKLFCYLEHNAVAKTSNLIERLFKYLKKSYKQIYHFRTESSCMNYLYTWVFWKNHRKYQRGKHKDKSPYELANANPKNWINQLI